MHTTFAYRYAVNIPHMHWCSSVKKAVGRGGIAHDARPSAALVRDLRKELPFLRSITDLYYLRVQIYCSHYIRLALCAQYQ